MTSIPIRAPLNSRGPIPWVSAKPGWHVKNVHLRDGVTTRSIGADLGTLVEALFRAN